MQADPKALLDAANQASEKVAALHVAFLALCTYILVVVFSTTDMDLLIGKGVKLPVVDVEVPIKGFYATVPYLLLIVHFNLLLQLQLLSRKLFAFDDAASHCEGIGELHGQLHTFPYTYYLVGRSAQLVHRLIAVLVATTILLLPVLTLVTIQARFLAYQSEPITWFQRMATWLDVALIMTLWPIIVDRGGSWMTFFLRVEKSARALPSLRLWRKLKCCWVNKKLCCAPKKNASPQILGIWGLLTTLVLGLPLPLLLTIVGEGIDRPDGVGTSLYSAWRTLSFPDQTLSGSPIKQDTLVELLREDPKSLEKSMDSIVPIDLRNRSLRGVNFAGAFLLKADLREAQLQGALLEGADLRRARLKNAVLTGAWLEKADLRGAQLESADLSGTVMNSVRLQGAVIYSANLAGAIMDGANLQGANLNSALMWGTILHSADLRGAHLVRADMRGAVLDWARLQGADVRLADLRGAQLTNAKLQGADLRMSYIYSETLSSAIIKLVDARGVKFRPILQLQQRDAENHIIDDRTWQSPEGAADFNTRIKAASTEGLTEPWLESCLRDEETDLQCRRVYSITELRGELFPYLKELACESPELAHGIITRLELMHERESSTSGLALKLHDFIHASAHLCPGIGFLPEVDRKSLEKLARDEDVERH